MYGLMEQYRVHVRHIVPERPSNSYIYGISRHEILKNVRQPPMCSI